MVVKAICKLAYKEFLVAGVPEKIVHCKENARFFWGERRQKLLCQFSGAVLTVATFLPNAKVSLLFFSFFLFLVDSSGLFSFLVDSSDIALPHGLIRISSTKIHGALTVH